MRQSVTLHLEVEHYGNSLSEKSQFLSSKKLFHLVLKVLFQFNKVVFNETLCGSCENEKNNNKIQSQLHKLNFNRIRLCISQVNYSKSMQ